MSVFSKDFQRDNTCLNDYFNNVVLLKKCLQDIDLNNCSQQMPNYDFQKSHDSVGLTIQPVRNLRSYSKQSDSSPLETVSREHKLIITGLVHSLIKQFRERPKQSELISEGALLLNDLCDDFVDNVEDILICGHCSSRLKGQSSQKKHYLKIMFFQSTAGFTNWVGKW